MAELHPAWAQLEEKLVWRRSACRIAEACSAAEAAKGSVLKHIQSTRFCSLLPRPKGSLNSYLDALPGLSAAVRAYMQADGGFYAQAPSENINYGGRGAGQQLWWCGDDKGWRVSQPDRLKLNPQPEGKPQSKRKQPASRGGFAPPLDAADEDAIRDEDIHLLPPVEAEPAPLPLPVPAPMSWWGPWGGSASTDELNGTPDSVSTATTDDGDLLTSSDEDGAWAGAAGYPDRPQTPPAPMPAEPAARHAPWLSATDARMYGGAAGGGSGAAWGADAAYTAAAPAAKRYRYAPRPAICGARSCRRLTVCCSVSSSNSPNLSTAFFFGLSVIAIVHHSVYVPLERAESSRRALSSSESLSLHEASVALEEVFVCRQSSSRPAELVPWAGWPEQCPLGVLLMVRGPPSRPHTPAPDAANSRRCRCCAPPQLSIACAAWTAGSNARHQPRPRRASICPRVPGQAAHHPPDPHVTRRHVERAHALGGGAWPGTWQLQRAGEFQSDGRSVADGVVWRVRSRRRRGAVCASSCSRTARRP